MSGFLGSSLFPSFNPIQRESDSESEQEALRNPVTVFSNIQLTETTPTTASTTTTTTTTQPAPSFPTFSSFSFNALKPSAQQPLSLQTASGTTSPSFNNHATTSPNDPDMSNNYHTTHASSNNKSTSSKRKKNKEKESKKKHKSKHHHSNNNKDDLEDGKVGPTDRYSAEKTLSGHSKRLLNVQMYYPSDNDAGAVVPSFQSKNNYSNTLTEGDLDIFTFDRKGDSENRRYGSANGSGGKGGSKVPRYHSVGS
ncbi:hypothetical protein BDR26DRAFT_585847 [Obelidium mucronatum]|nr:hypothetical protein BDR26DRAFT_585847 [Obelidium mucronatum]